MGSDPLDQLVKFGLSRSLPATVLAQYMPDDIYTLKLVTELPFSVHLILPGFCLQLLEYSGSEFAQSTIPLSAYILDPVCIYA